MPPLRNERYTATGNKVCRKAAMMLCLGNNLSIERDTAVLQRLKSYNSFEQSRFSCTICSDKRHNCTFIDAH